MCLLQVDVYESDQVPDRKRREDTVLLCSFSQARGAPVGLRIMLLKHFYHPRLKHGKNGIGERTSFAPWDRTGIRLGPKLADVHLADRRIWLR